VRNDLGKRKNCIDIGLNNMVAGFTDEQKLLEEEPT